MSEGGEKEKERKQGLEGMEGRKEEISYRRGR